MDLISGASAKRPDPRAYRDEEIDALEAAGAEATLIRIERQYQPHMSMADLMALPSTAIWQLDIQCDVQARIARHDELTQAAKRASQTANKRG